MSANVISRPVAPALAEFAVVPSPKDKGLDDARACIARAIGRLDVPHGGRVERWTLRRAQSGTLRVEATLRFPGVQRPIVAATTVGLAGSDWTVGSVAANQLGEAIADAYGLATYHEARE